MREANTFANSSRRPDLSESVIKFQKALEEFHTNQSPFLASELMGVARTLGLTEQASFLAEYVLTHPVLGSAAKWQAQSILAKPSLVPQGQPATDEEYSIRLSQLKKRTKSAPFDAIAWVEQARIYTILNQFFKADRAMRIALHLAPSDRYIVRAAIRFFAHWDNWEAALHYGKRAYSLNPDPLIFGPLLSVFTFLEKAPSKLRSILADSLASSLSFLHSETLEAAGTLEITHGAEKRSKKLFKKAWEDPTLAVVSHSQWVLRNHLPNMAKEQTIDFSQSREAMAWLRFIAMNFSASANTAQEWNLEEPYSAQPSILAANAACILEQYDRAETISKSALSVNPEHDVLINNLAFAQLRQGKTDEAEKTFAPLLKNIDDEDEVATVATYGLLQMRKGNVQEGVDLYTRAIRRAQKNQDRKLAVRAALHCSLSLFDVAHQIDPSLTENIAGGISEIDDPACIAVAKTLVEKLSRAKLPNAPELPLALEKLQQAVKKEEARYRSSLLVRSLTEAR